ncbi:MAG: hypothetical protein D6B25_19075 [Desulfobulbaceae bacterium]|nr:MAG: hypothetical protein D6B25_19075 [Desulfobulbaceae bacterium]
MFTVADIRDIAIQIEKNGEEAYRRAGEEAEDSALAEIFFYMADEEKKHRQWFESIKIDKVLSEEELALEEMGRQLLKEMIAGQTFTMDETSLSKVDSFREMVKQSQVFEKDTVLFYEFLKGIIDDAQVEKQLDQIIEEEQKHFAQLARMIDTANGESVTV